MKHIGLLGGSFDPPHRGHLYISLEVKKILSLDKIWWLVTPKNPLKISNPASYSERVDNCYKITEGHPIIIKETEKKINSKHTYQTLKYLQNQYPNIKFYWLIGSDNLVNFHKWQKWRDIFNEISIVIFKRHNYNEMALKSIASKTFLHSQIKSLKIKRIYFNTLPSWAWINNKEINISSTEIKKQRKLLRS